jgi:CHC2 zinc finger
MSSDDQKPWIDFKQIKESADVELVLERCGVLDGLQRQGAELVGWCPLGKSDQHGKADSFAFNTQKKTFQCFACKARGSILDFVSRLQGVGLREAATFVLSAMQPVLSDAGNTAAAPVLATTELPEIGSVSVKSIEFMTLDECLRRIQANSLKPQNVRCFDATAFVQFGHASD